MENHIVPDFSSVARETAPLTQTSKKMLEVEHDGAQTYVKVNSSSLSIMQACPRKALYSLEEKWRPKVASTALVFGSAIHKALDVFYSHSCRERELPPNFDEVAPLLGHGHDAPTKHFLYDAIQAFVQEGQSLQALPDTDPQSISAGIWLLQNYFKCYIKDVYVIHADEQGPLTERTFTTPVYEDKQLRVELFGTIDFVLRNEATGELLPGDHKTTSQLGKDFLNRIKPNHQYTAYMLGAQQALGLTGEHFMVNGLQKKARPLRNAAPPQFSRQITRRTEQDFQEFRDALLHSVRNYLNWRLTGVWPIGSVDACAMWGGCSFLEVCSAPNELRLNILDAKFNRE